MTAVVVEVDAHEGPVYVADEDALYFTSVPAPRRRDQAARRSRSGEVSVLRADANAGQRHGPATPTAGCSSASRAPATPPARISLVDRATGAAETWSTAGAGCR